MTTDQTYIKTPVSSAEEKEQRIAKKDDPGKGPEGILPDLEARVVIGIFEQPDQANLAISELHNAGYTQEDISAVMQAPGSAAELGSSETKAQQGAAVGITAGALLGGALSLVVLAIPGVGPLLAAGPLAAAISGALVGGSLGGLVGSLAGLGIPNEHAQAYEEAIRVGGIVVAVRTSDREAATRVEQLLSTHSAREVASYTQAL